MNVCGLVYDTKDYFIVEFNFTDWGQFRKINFCDYFFWQKFLPFRLLLFVSIMK